MSKPAPGHRALIDNFRLVRTRYPHSRRHGRPRIGLICILAHFGSLPGPVVSTTLQVAEMLVDERTRGQDGGGDGDGVCPGNGGAPLVWDLKNLETDLHDGVLTVRIPVAEQPKPRKVKVGQNRQSTPNAIETSATSAPPGRAMPQPSRPGAIEGVGQSASS